MRTSNGGFSVAANLPRRDVDNRISLQKYYRIADNILKQADIFRGEKNVLDLYIMLLRFSSLITETISCHRDYKSSLQREKVLFRKKLLNIMNELEVLKPVVQQMIDEMNRKARNQLDGRGHFQSNYSNNSLEWPPVKSQVPNNNEVKKISRFVGSNGAYQGSQDKLSTSWPMEEQFRKFTLNIPRLKEETLSRHSILGPTGLRGQWQAPISNIGVQYPSNIDLTPIEFTSLQQPEPEKVPVPNDSSSELERTTLESIYSLSVDSQPHLTEPCSAISLDSGMLEPHIQTNIIRQPSISPVLAEVQDLVPVITPPVSDSGVEFENSLQDELARSNSPLQLHISTAMMENFMRLAKSNTDKNLETCGILAGSLKNRMIFVTTPIIPKQEGTSDSCQATNEEEIFDVQDKRSLFPLGWIHERMEEMAQQMTLESGGHSGSSGVALTSVLGPGTKEKERLQGRVKPKGRKKMSASDFRAYEERVRESEATTRELQETTRELQETTRDLQRRDEEKTREMERMREQLNALIQSLQNPPQGPPP